MRRVLLGIFSAFSGLAVLVVLLMNVCGAPDKIGKRNQTAEPSEFETEKCNVITIEFPFELPGTDLIIERNAVYDGPFLEDSTNKEVFDVMAVLLRNTGSVGVRNVELLLEQGSEKLYFEAETIPPGAAVLVLEKNATKVNNKPFTDYALVCMSLGDMSMENSPDFEPLEMDKLKIINDTGLPLNNLWIYYKNYSQEADIYIGGITYKVGIRRLDPGKIQVIQLPYYAYGYSKIAAVMAG